MMYHSQSFNTNSEDAFFGRRSFKGRVIRTALKRRMVLKALAAKKRQANLAKRKYIKKNGMQPLRNRKRRMRKAVKRVPKTKVITGRSQTAPLVNSKPIMPKRKTPKARIKRVVRFQPFAATKPEKKREEIAVKEPNKKKNNTNLYIGITLAAIAATGLLLYLKNKK